MDVGLISRRYARTLYMFASSKGVLEAVYDESMLLSERMLQLPRLRDALASRVLEPKRKVELVNAAVGGSLSDEFARFIRLVIKGGREKYLTIILWIFQAMARAGMKRLHAKLATAAEIDDKTLGLITAEMSEKVGADVTLITEVDPSLVGGYVLRWDTYRLDASVKGRLSRIRTALTENKH